MCKPHVPVIIIVIASKGGIYNSLIPFWERIANNQDSSTNTKVFLVYGNNSNVKSNEYTIIAPYKENRVPGILKKTIYAFNYVSKKFNYDYIFRTNISSFVYRDGLYDYSKKLPRDRCYCSVFHKTKSNPIKGRLSKKGIIKDFVWGHGAGFFISKDLVQMFLNNKESLRYGIIDDVSIGFFISNQKNINYIKQKRSNVTFKRKISPIQMNKLINNIITNKHFHVRIKNSNNRKIDVRVMRRLFIALYKL